MIIFRPRALIEKSPLWTVRTIRNEPIAGGIDQHFERFMARRDGPDIDVGRGGHERERLPVLVLMDACRRRVINVVPALRTEKMGYSLGGRPAMRGTPHDIAAQPNPF